MKILIILSLIIMATHAESPFSGWRVALSFSEVAIERSNRNMSTKGFSWKLHSA